MQRYRENQAEKSREKWIEVRPTKIFALTVAFVLRKLKPNYGSRDQVNGLASPS